MRYELVQDAREDGGTGYLMLREQLTGSVARLQASDRLLSETFLELLSRARLIRKDWTAWGPVVGAMRGRCFRFSWLSTLGGKWASSGGDATASCQEEA